MTSIQSNFLDKVIGLYWVVITKGHQVFKEGSRFLVIEEQAKGWVLAWRDGIAPYDTLNGTALHPNYFERELWAPE